MNYACNMNLLPGASFEQKLACAAAAGFSHINDSATGAAGERLMSERGFSEYLSIFKASGLKMDWLHAPFVMVRPDSSNAEERAVAVACQKMYVERAAELGAATLVIHPFFEHLDEKHSVEEAYACVSACCREIALHGKKKGVAVALENMPYKEHHELVVKCLDEVPELGFCLDTGHAEIAKNWDMWLDKYIPRICALHIHDNDGEGDLHYYPGEGKIDWRAFSRRLKAGGFAGTWSLEILRSRMDDAKPEEIFRKAFDRLDKVVKENI
ncbi:MAG: sugar phosphate isomerase/epimerase [Planctomycetes bacterium]|nr:sugar phosphate isomerase/epimerase [Planctomycetota bacterium]